MVLMCARVFTWLPDTILFFTPVSTCAAVKLVPGGVAFVATISENSSFGLLAHFHWLYCEPCAVLPPELLITSPLFRLKKTQKPFVKTGFHWSLSAEPSDHWMSGAPL